MNQNHFVALKLLVTVIPQLKSEYLPSKWATIHIQTVRSTFKGAFENIIIIISLSAAES